MAADAQGTVNHRGFAPAYGQPISAMPLRRSQKMVPMSWACAWSGWRPLILIPIVQVEMIENLIRRGVDGILASVNDEEAIHKVFQKAMEQGIAVATLMGTARQRTPFSYRHRQLQRRRGHRHALVGVLKGRGLENAELDTMIMTGFREAFHHEERIRAF